MPFKFWFYLCKFAPFLFFGTFVFFILDSISFFGYLRIFAIGLIILIGICGGIMGIFAALEMLRMKCPFCENLGVPRLNKEVGMYMDCKTCGQIKGYGLFRLKLKKEKMIGGELRGLKVDLGSFFCGPAKLGDSLSKIETFAKYLKDYETLNDESSGMEIGLKKGNLDSVFITMANSTAIFLKSGTPITITNRTTVADIKSIFGSPYWVDEDEGEVILFYEYDNGEVELQFEFPKRLPLGFITLMKNGILSNEIQRKSYRVTKSWPPQNPIHR